MRPIPYNPRKISILPRQQTEATILLDLHKLVSEKNRLQQELIKLEVRQAYIYDRLKQIKLNRAQLEQSRTAVRRRSIAPLSPLHLHPQLPTTFHSSNTNDARSRSTARTDSPTRDL